jgi:hypothetical protein
MLVTFSELATIKGCTPAAVHHASKNRIADAVVVKDGKRWLDRDLALELWRRNTLKNNNAKVDEPDNELVPDDEIPDLNESRARREHYQAELSKLQVSQQRGDLVPADEVRKAAFQVGRSVREALSNLADRLSHQLAGETDPAVIHQLLSDEHRDALLALAEVEAKE